MAKNISLPVKTKFENAEQVNPELTRCKCYVMALGKNRNMSHFSREAVEDALPTLKNVPVVAFIHEGEDGKMHVAGHETVVEEKDGRYVWKSICVPYGVVPADAQFSFEDVVEPNGITTTYLTSDVILWTGRYPELIETAYDDTTYFNQSMEIHAEQVEKLEEDDNYYDIKKFSFSALCLLGKSDDDEYNVEPCFPASAVVAYAFDEQFENLMSEFKTIMSSCFAMNTKDGGDNVDENKIEPQNEEFEAEVNEEPVIEEYVEEEPVVEFEQVEESVESEATENEIFSLTANEKRSAINAALPRTCERDDNDVLVRAEEYYVMDFDDEYVYVACSIYDGNSWKENHYRVAYTINGADVTIGEFESIVSMWLTEDEANEVRNMRSEFDAYRESHTAENSEVDELREFKAERLRIDHEIEVDNVMAQFNDLNGNEAFDELKRVAYSYENLNELEDKCYAIRGRSIKAATKSVENFETVVKSHKHKASVSDDDYTGLFEKYGYKKNN